jgi:hypothetical protein
LAAAPPPDKSSGYRVEALTPYCALLTNDSVDKGGASNGHSAPDVLVMMDDASRCFRLVIGSEATKGTPQPMALVRMNV